MNRVPVIFRKWNDGDVIALFPTIPASVTDPNIMMSYEHIGQHDGADYQIVYLKTVAARPDEYHKLLSELETIGYEVKPVSKITQQMVTKRIETWKEWMKK